MDSSGSFDASDGVVDGSDNVNGVDVDESSDNVAVDGSSDDVESDVAVDGSSDSVVDDDSVTITISKDLLEQIVNGSSDVSGEEDSSVLDSETVSDEDNLSGNSVLDNTVSTSSAGSSGGGGGSSASPTHSGYAVAVDLDEEETDEYTETSVTEYQEQVLNRLDVISVSSILSTCIFFLLLLRVHRR
jgi:hypothetical protein